MKESKKKLEVISCRKIFRIYAQLPFLLWLLSLCCIITACGQYQVEQPPPEGMAMSKGIHLAGERAVKAGLKTITVDLDNFSERKIRRICLQSYSEYSSLSKISQAEQFEQEINEDMRPIGYWPSLPSGESEYRFVVFFDHGEPTWFNYTFSGRDDRRNESTCDDSSLLRLIQYDFEMPAGYGVRPGRKLAWDAFWVTNK